MEGTRFLYLDTSHTAILLFPYPYLASATYSAYSRLNSRQTAATSKDRRGHNFKSMILIYLLPRNRLIPNMPSRTGHRMDSKHVSFRAEKFTMHAACHCLAIHTEYCLYVSIILMATFLSLYNHCDESAPLFTVSTTTSNFRARNTNL